MAYGLKYIALFDTVNNIEKVKETYRIKLSRDGYGGAVSTLKTGGKPIVRKYQNTNDEVVGLMPLVVDLEFRHGGELSDLFSYKQKDWLCEIERWIGAEPTTPPKIFVGYLAPSAIPTDYVDGGRYVRVQAIDGLSFLKNIDFVDGSGVFYGQSLFSVGFAIHRCFELVGTGLKWNHIFNTFHHTMSEAYTTSALYQMNFHAELLRNKDKPKEAYDVLNEIIESIGCRVYQQDGEWWVESVPEKYTGSVKWRRNDSVFVETGGVLNLNKSVGHGLSLQPMAGGEKTDEMPYKYVEFEHTITDNRNIIPNIDFRTWNGVSFDGWNTYLDTELSRVGTGSALSPFGAKLTGFRTKVNNLSKNINSTKITIGTNKEGLKGFVKFSGEVFTHDVKAATCMVTLQISFSNGLPIKEWFLTKENGWSRIADYLVLDNLDVNKRAKRSKLNFSFESDLLQTLDSSNIVVTGQYLDWMEHISEINLYILLANGYKQSEPYPNETLDSYVIWQNLNLQVIDAAVNENLNKIRYLSKHNDYSPLEVKYVTKFGDYIDKENISTLRLNDGTVCSQWRSDRWTEYLNFHQQIGFGLIHLLGNSTRVFDGTIKGNLKFGDVITMTGFDKKLYVIGWSRDDETGFTAVRLREFGTVSVVNSVKKGVLTDGTEYDMVGNALPSKLSKGDFRPVDDDIFLGLKVEAAKYFGKIDAIPLETEVVGAGIEKGKLKLGVEYAELVDIGNPEFLHDLVPSGRRINMNLPVKVGENLIYDTSFVDGDGSIDRKISIDTQTLHVLGVTETPELSVNQGTVRIFTTDEDTTKKVKVWSEFDDLYIGGKTNVIIESKLGVSEIYGVNGTIEAKNNWVFSENVSILSTPSLPNHLVTYQTLQNAIAAGGVAGTDVKLCFQTNQGFSGAKTQGGYTTVTNDLCLFMAQNDGKENGIYAFDGTTWARPTTYDAGTELIGKVHFVVGGDFANYRFQNKNSSAITIGTDVINYATFSAVEIDPVFTAWKNTVLLGSRVLASPVNGGVAEFRGLVQADIPALDFLTKISNKPTTIAGYGITDFNALFSVQFGGYYAANIIGEVGYLPVFKGGNTLKSDLGKSSIYYEYGASGSVDLLRFGVVGGGNPLNVIFDSAATTFNGDISATNSNTRINANAISVSRPFMINGDAGQLGQVLKSKGGGAAPSLSSGANRPYWDYVQDNWGQSQLGLGFTTISGVVASTKWGFHHVDGSGLGSGLVTGLPNDLVKGYVARLALGSDNTTQSVLFGFGSPFNTNFNDKNLYVKGIDSVNGNSDWIKLGGGLQYTEGGLSGYDGGIGLDLVGDLLEGSVEGRLEVFVDNGKLDLVMYEYDEATTNTLRYGFRIDKTTKNVYFVNENIEKRILTVDDVVSGGGGTVFSPVLPLRLNNGSLTIDQAGEVNGGYVSALNYRDWYAKIGKEGGTIDGGALVISGNNLILENKIEISPAGQTFSLLQFVNNLNGNNGTFSFDGVANEFSYTSNTSNKVFFGNLASALGEFNISVVNFILNNVRFDLSALYNKTNGAAVTWVKNSEVIGGGHTRLILTAV